MAMFAAQSSTSAPGPEILRLMSVGVLLYPKPTYPMRETHSSGPMGLSARLSCSVLPPASSTTRVTVTVSEPPVPHERVSFHLLSVPRQRN